MRSSLKVIKAGKQLTHDQVWLPVDLGSSPQPGRGGETVPWQTPVLNGNSTPAAYPTKLPASGRGVIKPNGGSSAFEKWLPGNSAVQGSGASAPSANEKLNSDFSELRKTMLSEAATEAALQSQQILQDARLQSEAIIRQAQEEAAEVTQQARRQGMAAAESESARLLRAAQSILDEVHAWRESMLAQSERTVINLVTDIAKTIFGTGFAIDPVILQTTFERVLSEAKSLGDLLVHVHPEDASILSPSWVAGQTNSNGRRVELIPDPSIRRGGCLIEGQFGQIDARIETKWEAVEESLTRTLTSNEEKRNQTETQGDQK